MTETKDEVKRCRCGEPQGRFHRMLIPSMTPICDKYPRCDPVTVENETDVRADRTEKPET